MARGVTVDFNANVARFSSGVDKATNDLNKFQSNATRVSGQIEKTFLGLGGAGLLAKLGGAASIVGIFSKIVTETQNAEAEQAQLAAVLESTGRAAGFAQTELNKMADSLSKNSTFASGDITNAQTRLLSYTGVVGKQFPQAMKAVVDMSARLNISLEQSAETIGRALDIPTQGLTALSKQGFRFSDAQKELIKSLEDSGRAAEAQDIILKTLESSYGGAAEAARNTLGGSIKALTNQFDDLFDLNSSGSVFATVINDISIALEAMTSAANKVPFDALDRLLPSYQKYKEALEASQTETVGGNNLILPRNAKIGDVPKTTFSDMPLLMSQGASVTTLLDGIKAKADKFKSDNPLKDVIAKQDAYKTSLAEINELERQGGITAELAARYRQQLYDTLNTKSTGKSQVQKTAEDTAKLIEEFEKAVAPAKTLSETLQDQLSAYGNLDAGVRNYLQGITDQVAANERLKKSTEDWLELEGMQAKQAAEELRDLEALSAAEVSRSESLERQAQAIRELYDPSLKLMNLQDGYNQLLEEGYISQEEYTFVLEQAIDAQADLAEKGKDQFEELKRAIEGFGDAAAETFVEFAFNGKASFGDFVDSALKDLAKLAIKRGITDDLFGAADSFLSGIFGGFSFGGARASGGPVVAGKSYIVGEKGPELLTLGSMGGNIIPNDVLGRSSGGGDVSVMVNVDASGGDVSSNAEFGKRLGKAVKQAIQAELLDQRRTGGALA